MTRSLKDIRTAIDDVDDRLVELLSERGRLAEEIARAKVERGDPFIDPQRENEIMKAVLRANPGPFPDSALAAIFREVIDHSREIVLQAGIKRLRVQRRPGEPDATVAVGQTLLGAGLQYIAGPCAVEGEEMLDEVARALSAAGVKLLRGGAFKPRTSPYAFQGLGARGLEMLRRTADRYGMSVVTEVMDARDAPLVAEYADLLQVGARNMYNYPLLRELGATGRPILLKRALSATIEEFLLSAEYVMMHGNDQVVLCERGIRTFEQETRNTLDLSAVAILRKRTTCPIVVDVSHAAGRRDILGDLTAAAFATGACAVMIEVHPAPERAVSDRAQQLTPESFVSLMQQVRDGLRSLAPPAP